MNTLLKHHQIALCLIIGIVSCAPREVVKPQEAQELPVAETELQMIEPQPHRTEPVPPRTYKKPPAKAQVSPCATMLRSCDNNCDSYKPTMLYLAGGKAKELFEGYLSENKGIKSRIPMSFKIKFYERDGAGLKLQTVKADPISLMGIDSKESLLNMFRSQLDGRIAEPVDKTALFDEAKKEKADLFLCTASKIDKKTVKKEKSKACVDRKHEEREVDIQHS